MAIGLWVVLCAGTGFAAAYAIAEHGSIMFAGIGVILGAVGAAVHSVLLLVPKFRSSSFSKQVVAVWLGTLGLVSLGLVLVNWNSPQELAASLSGFMFFSAVPALLASAAIHWLLIKAQTPNPSIERTPNGAAHVER